MNAMMRHNKG